MLAPPFPSYVALYSCYSSQTTLRSMEILSRFEFKEKHFQHRHQDNKWKLSCKYRCLYHCYIIGRETFSLLLLVPLSCWTASITNHSQNYWLKPILVNEDAGIILIPQLNSSYLPSCTVLASFEL